MTEPAKLCEICHTNEPEFGRVCDQCKQMPKAFGLHQNAGEVVDSPVEQQWYSCPDHGDHQGVKIGKNWSSHCPQCIQEKRTAGVRRTRGKQLQPRETPVADLDQSYQKPADDPLVLVDFSDCRWVVGLIQKETSLPPAVYIKRKIAAEMLDKLTDAELKLLIMSGIV